MASCLLGCGRLQYSQGLCKSHAASVRRKIKAGELDEAEEIAAGRMLKKKKPGGAHWRRYPAIAPCDVSGNLNQVRQPAG